MGALPDMVMVVAVTVGDVCSTGAYGTVEYKCLKIGINCIVTYIREPYY